MVGDKIINLMLLFMVVVMVSPNDKAPVGTTFGNCLSRPRTRSFYDASSELIALTKRGGLWDPPSTTGAIRISRGLQNWLSIWCIRIICPLTWVEL